jgi:DNA-binding MarR family transcriptional regulator
MQLEALMVELINSFTQEIREYKEKLLGQDELSHLTMTEYYYLIAINKLDSPTYSDLAKELKVTKPSVTANVNKMIQKGYIYKVQNQKDKRVFHLQLDEKGEKLIKVEKNISYEFAKNAVSCLTEVEQEQLQRIFEKTLMYIRK